MISLRVLRPFALSVVEWANGSGQAPRSNLIEIATAPSGPRNNFFRGFILIFFLLIPVFAFARDCIDWPRVMTQEALNQASGGKIVVVETFNDYTKQPGDEWLSAGLRDLLSSMLSASDGLRVLSGLSAKYSPDASHPAFFVSGMFQHIGDKVRAFVKVQKGDDRSLVSQYEIVSLYPENKELFLRFAEATRQIWKIMSVGGDDSRLEAVQDATQSTRCFESYIKGKMALETYKMTEMEVAKTWFEQARSIDYRSPLGYAGLIDLMTFLGFYHKQRQEPSGQYFEQAEKELAQMQRLAKRPPPVTVLAKKPSKKEKEETKLGNRFLLGQAAFTEGVIASQEGNTQQAAMALQKAVQFVPEDAIAWYHLARMYEKLGNNPEATNALQKAYAINPCIEK